MNIQSTKLLYMTDMYTLESEAHIIDIVDWENNKIALVLDSTVFYPQGGGQPYDCGSIVKNGATFQVEQVRKNDGLVYHIGSFITGCFEKGDIVSLQVDKQRREVNNKYHTAGHIVDIALANLGINLIPGKGHHFPGEAYVEYIGTVDGDNQENLLSQLQNEVDVLIQKNYPIFIKEVSAAEFKKISSIAPDYILQQPSIRIMVVDSYEPFACGGTHVVSTGHINSLKIEKIKNKKGNLRVSYSVS